MSSSYNFPHNVVLMDFLTHLLPPSLIQCYLLLQSLAVSSAGFISRGSSGPASSLSSSSVQISFIQKGFFPLASLIYAFIHTRPSTLILYSQGTTVILLLQYLLWILYTFNACIHLSIYIWLLFNNTLSSIT